MGDDPDATLRADLVWQPRHVGMQEVLRYGYEPEENLIEVDGVKNYWWLQHSPRGAKKIMLMAGINGSAAVAATDGRRSPVIALRSSPHKAGSDETPWHDEYDLDHGHIRYFGDHKVSTLGPVGSTKGNKQLLAAAALHSSGLSAERLLAPPVLVFKAIPHWEGQRRVDSGYLEFCGVSIIERLEYVVQRDPRSGRTFPNIVLDLNVVRLDDHDELDFRWLDDRFDPEVSAEKSLRFAPDSWREWVKSGRVVLPSVRRRVMSSRVLSREQQMPDRGSVQEKILTQVYRAFDDKKHAFEWLAARVAEHVLTESGSRYTAGWLTRAGGDGGMDFVGRLDVGSTAAKTPLVVLGQAKCIVPGNSISPDQVARVVARLRRGWVGVFVTTGVFSQQAQVEIVDDEYPIVLIGARTLADAVYRIANESYSGDVDAVLREALEKYGDSVTHRQPSEVLSV